MQNLLNIILWLLVSAGVAFFANQRGRDPLAWFMIGMLLGFLGLILLFLLPPIPEEEPQQEAEYAHLEQKKEEVNPISDQDNLIKDWYYFDQEKKMQGPIRFSALEQLWRAGVVDANTFVWAEGMGQWEQIGKLQNLHTLLEGILKP
jgi:hypothetical protein